MIFIYSLGGNICTIHCRNTNVFDYEGLPRLHWGAEHYKADSTELSFCNMENSEF